MYWLDNGRPHLRVVADLICKIRAKYHVRKMALKMDAEIRCDKMAEAI